MRLDQRLAQYKNYAIQSLECGHITKEQLEAARNSAKRKLKKSTAIWIRIAPFWPLTKKPQETRMGKGKGSKLRGWVSPVKKGKIIMEIFSKFLKPSAIVASLRSAQFRLPVKSKITQMKF